MTKGVRYILNCDPCDLDESPNVPGVATRVISIDGMPPTEIDVCTRDNYLINWLLKVCKEQGRPIERKEERLAKATEKVREAKGTRRKELERVPAQKEFKEVPEKETVYIFCPKDHHVGDGGPRRISYKNRNSHVEQCHPGMGIWDIEWGDPDGHLKHPCHAHAECQKVNLSFTTARGLGHHVRGSALETVTQA